MASTRSLISCRSAVAVAAMLFAASGTHADWAEVGDAGQLPSTAQSVTGGGALTKITGDLAAATADMFQVYISGAFTASTVGTSGTLADSQLFLFNSAGYGVLGNDDFNNTTLRSTLTGSVPAGIYYLAISGFNLEPLSSGGAIFPNTQYDLNVPTGSGGTLPISGWSSSGAGGTYEITLTGVSIVPLPTAAYAGLSGLAAAIGVTALRRRRLR